MLECSLLIARKVPYSPVAVKGSSTTEAAEEPAFSLFIIVIVIDRGPARGSVIRDRRTYVQSL
jgi:hypothetical protein